MGDAIKNMSRTVSRDVELRDRQLHEGDQLILLYPSANRDEDVFADPFRLDVGRDPNRILPSGSARISASGRRSPAWSSR